jgi:hypothetical protein
VADLPFLFSGDSEQLKDKLYQRELSASVEALILDWWKRPSTEIDVNLHSVDAQIDQIKFNLDSFRFSDRVLSSDQREAPWWTSVGMIHSGITATNVSVSEVGDSDPSILLTGINLLQASWMKNLVAHHRGARDFLSPSFPASSVDANLATNTKASLRFSGGSIAALGDAVGKILSIFGLASSKPLLGSDLLPGVFDLELGNSSFMQSTSPFSILKFEAVHLNAQFTDAAGFCHRIIQFANPQGSNRSAVAVSTRIPSIPTNELSSVPLIHILTLQAQIFTPAPFLRWILSCQRAFKHSSGLMSSKQHPLVLQIDEKESSIEDSLPSDFASNLITFFSDSFSFQVCHCRILFDLFLVLANRFPPQWPTWSRASLNVDVHPLQLILAPEFSHCDAVVLGFESIRANLSHREEFAASLIQATGLFARLVSLNEPQSRPSDILSPFSIKASLVESRTPSASPTMTKKLESPISVDPIRLSLSPRVLNVYKIVLNALENSNEEDDVADQHAKPVSVHPISRILHRRTTSKDHLGLIALAAMRVSLTIPSIQISLADADEAILSLKAESISCVLNLSWRANMIMENTLARLIIQVKDKESVTKQLLTCGGATAMFSSLYSSGDALQRALSQACAEFSLYPIDIMTDHRSLLASTMCISSCMPSSKSRTTQSTGRLPNSSWRFQAPVIFRAGKISFQHSNLIGASIGSIHLSAGMIQHQNPGSDSPVLGQLLSVQVSQIVSPGILADLSLKVDRITQASIQKARLNVEEAISITVPDSKLGICFQINQNMLQNTLKFLRELQSATAVLQRSPSSPAAVSVPLDPSSSHEISVNIDFPFIELCLGDQPYFLTVWRPVMSLRGLPKWQLTVTVDSLDSKSDSWLYWSGPKPPKVLLVRSEPPISGSSASRSVFVDVHPGLCILISKPLLQCFLSIAAASSSQEPRDTLTRAPSVSSQRDSIQKLYDFISSLDLKFNLGSVSLAIDAEAESADFCSHFEQLFLACSTVNSGERTAVLSIIGLCLQRSLPRAPNGFVAHPDQFLVEPFDFSAQLRLSLRENIHSKSFSHVNKLCYAQGQLEFINSLRVRVFGEDLRALKSLASLFRSDKPKKPRENTLDAIADVPSHKATLTSLALHVTAGTPTASIERNFPVAGALDISPWVSESRSKDPNVAVEGVLIRWRLPQLIEVDSVDFLLTPILQDVSWNKQVSASITIYSFNVDSYESHVVAEQQGEKFRQFNPVRDAGTVPMLSAACKISSDANLSALSDAWAVRIRFSEPLSPKLTIPESLLSLLACLDVQIRVAPPSVFDSSLLVDLSLDQSLDIEVNLTGDRQNPLQAGTILNLSVNDLRARGRVGPGLQGRNMTSSIIQGLLDVSQSDSTDLGVRRILHPTNFDVSLKQYASRQEITCDMSGGIDIEVSPSSVVELSKAMDGFLSSKNDRGLFTQIVVCNTTASSLYYGQLGAKEILCIHPQSTQAYAWRKLMSPSQRVLQFQLDPDADQTSSLNAKVDLNKLIERFWTEKNQILRWQSNFLLRIDDSNSVLLHISVKIDEFRIRLKLEGSHKIKKASYLSQVVIHVPEESTSLYSDDPVVVLKKRVSLLRTIPASSSSSTSSLGPQTVSVSALPFQSGPQAVDRIALSPHAPRRCFGSFIMVSTASATSGSEARATTSSVTVLRTCSVIRNMMSIRNLTPLTLESKFEHPLQDQISSPVVSCAPGETAPFDFDPNLLLESASSTGNSLVMPLRFKFRDLTSWSYPQILFSMNRTNAPSSLNLYVKLNGTVEQRQVPVVAEIIDEDGVQVIQISCSYLLVNHTTHGFVFYRGEAQVASSKVKTDAAGALSPDSVIVKAGDAIPYFWKSEKKGSDTPVSPLTLGFVVGDSADSSATVLWSNSVEPRIGADQMFVFRRSSKDMSFYDAFVLSCMRGAEPSAPIQLVIKPRFILTNRTSMDLTVMNSGTKSSFSLKRGEESRHLNEWARSESSGGLDTRLQIGLDVSTLSRSIDISLVRQRTHIFVPTDEKIRRYLPLVISAADVDGTSHVVISEEQNAPYCVRNDCDFEVDFRFMKGCAAELANRTFVLAPGESLDVLHAVVQDNSDSSTLFVEPDPKASQIMVSFKQSNVTTWSDPINVLSLTKSNLLQLTQSGGRDKCSLALDSSASGGTTKLVRIRSSSSQSPSSVAAPSSSTKSARITLRMPKISVSIRDKLSLLSAVSASTSISPSAPAAPNMLASPQIIWSHSELEDELLLLTVTQLSVQFGSVADKKSLLLHLSGLQLDSFIPESQFSVPLSLSAKQEDDGQSQGALYVSASFSGRSVQSLVVSFSSELTASLDERLLQYFKDLSKRMSVLKPRSSTSVIRVSTPYSLQVGVVADALATHPIYIHTLSVTMPSKVRLSAQIRPGKGRVFVSFSDAIISFRPLRAGRISCYSDRLLQAIMSHYIGEALPQAPAALASLDVLGNPLKLVRHFGAGVRDFLILPIQFTAEKGALGLAEGIVRGSGSLFGHVTGGVLQSFSGLSQSLARVLDPEHQGLLGVTSIVTQPIQAVKSSGISGLARGLTSGLFRAITAPIGGALDFVSATTSDLSDSVLAVPLSWVRQPRSPIPVPQVMRVSAYSTHKYRSKVLPFEFPGQPILLQQVLLADLIGTSAETPCVILLCSHGFMLIMMNDEVLNIVKATQIKKSSTQENTLLVDPTTQVRFPSAKSVSRVMRWFVSK